MILIDYNLIPNQYAILHYILHIVRFYYGNFPILMLIQTFNYIDKLLLQSLQSDYNIIIIMEIINAI